MDNKEPNKLPDRYQRISCDLYDYYEIWAMRKQEIVVDLKTEDDTIETVSLVIETLETKDKEEYLISKEGLRIRLDRIIDAKVKAQ